MRRIFGDNLLLKKLDPKETAMPSPDALKRKILVKAKSIKNSSAEDGDDDDDEHDLADNTVDSSSSIPSVKSGTAKSAAAAAAAAKSASMKKAKAKHSGKYAEELSDLVVYFASTRFKSFEAAKEEITYDQVVSFGEKKALTLASKSQVEMIEFTTRTMARIYPAGSRVDSSNFDPFPYWQAGCQTVALNYQTHDLPMLINAARFSENGRAGYLLKPAHLRNKMSQPSHPIRVVIEVLSGRSLPKFNNRVLDPIVEIQLIGPEPDLKLDVTPVVPHNGFNPTWKHTTTLDVLHPDFSFIRFSVKDGSMDRKDEPVGQCWVPVLAMGVGHRTVPLVDDRLNSLHLASLFVHVTIGAYSQPVEAPGAAAPGTPVPGKLDKERRSTFEGVSGGASSSSGPSSPTSPDGAGLAAGNRISQRVSSLDAAKEKA